MTDSAGALRRTPGKESHFLVTRVEQSSRDDSVSDDGETATPSSVFSSGRAAEGGPSSNVVFKIGDSPVFSSSRTDSTGLSLPLHSAHPETSSSAATASSFSNSDTSVANMIHSHSSRFHIVTLDDNPFRRGRWLCKEKQVTVDPKPAGEVIVESARRKFTVQPVATTAPAVSGNGSTGLSSQPLVTASTPFLSANASSQNVNSYQIPRTSAVESDGILSSVPEALAGGTPYDEVGQSTIDAAKSTVPSTTAAPEGPKEASTSDAASKPLLNLVNGGENAGKTLDSLLPTVPSPIETVVEQLSADQILREIESQAATGGSTLESGATPSEVAIDNKIEQAMDLVKTHLLYAVREEVEVLKERIDKLERMSRRLEAENRVLREHAPPEVIAQLGSLMASKGSASGTALSSPLPVPLVNVVGPPNPSGEGSSGALTGRAEGEG